MVIAKKGSKSTDNNKENIFTALSVGSLFIIISVIYIIHLPSSLLDRIVDFFMSFTFSTVPNTGIILPAPSNSPAHVELFTAGFEFAIAIGAVEIIILTIRVLMNSPINRKAETIENIVFWLGTSYLINTYLVKMTLTTEWFVFWSGVILIFGLALLTRALVLVAKH